MTRVARQNLSTAALLWTCVALFAFRVIAQLEVWFDEPSWLPDM